MTTGTGKTDNKSRTVSIRLTDAEHQRIRSIANRLGSSESTVLRFAIRSMLTRTGPLSDPDSGAYSLIPVFVEYGNELMNYFDLDSNSLDRIINGDASDTEQKVETADLKLLSVSRLSEAHVHASLKELNAQELAHGDVPTMLRGYFYEKYIYEKKNSDSDESAQQDDALTK